MEEYKIFILGSGRHCHVTEDVFKALFGEGATLTKVRELYEDPLAGFLAEEKVTVVGAKGEFKASILGPFRKYTQVEISRTDATNYGFEPVMSNSGELEGTCPCVLKGPKGEVKLKEGVMVVRRHVHLDPLIAEKLGVTKESALKVKVGGPRGLIFDQCALAPNSPGVPSVLHIDYDEMNAIGVTNKEKPWGTLIFDPDDKLVY